MRNRFKYIVLAFLIIAIALFTRHIGWAYLPHCINFWIGDFLWAFMLFFGAAGVFRSRSTVWVAVFVLLGCYGVECSQLYHAAWIDGLRQNFFAELILGRGFLWSDLVAYTGGVFLGACFDRFLIK